jgi:hypothetical protein
MMLAQILFLIFLGEAQQPVPSTPGLYYLDAGTMTRVEGRVVSFVRTGSLLASAATAGIKTRKGNVQIPGKTSEIKVSPSPVFYYRVPPGGEAVGGTAGDLVLVRLQVKHQRRQFEVSAGGQWRGSSGISIRSQAEFHKKMVEPGLYRIAPVKGLKPGEYGFYLFRGYDLPGFIYDFGVE